MMAKTNTMGSKVADGYKCKPVNRDPDKPIMHYKTQLFICDGKRCSTCNSEEFAYELREILKELELHVGKNRIKITRTNCFGACRYRQVAQIVENTQRNGTVSNNCLWIKNIHQYSKQRWIEIFKALANGESIKPYCHYIEMEEI
jgi:hypothetical protein